MVVIVAGIVVELGCLVEPIKIAVILVGQTIIVALVIFYKGNM